jgi:1-acyl-sn-glycerol-3-phosphate acyltransferase
MRLVRAAVFNTAFYGLLVAYMLLIPVLAVVPPAQGFKVARHLFRTQLRLQRLFGIRMEVRGRENLPASGALIAAKHQSMWETFALVDVLPEPAFIYKRELGRLPLFGYYLRRFGMIEVDRKGGASALRAMARAARAAVDAGRQVVIFPEGTRREAGAPPAYKYGVAKMYVEIDRPVTPIALDSGLTWSAYFWRGEPGTIVVDILPAIPAGLGADAFFAELQRTIERSSDALILEAAARPGAPPLPDSAEARRRALTAGQPVELS